MALNYHNSKTCIPLQFFLTPHTNWALTKNKISIRFNEKYTVELINADRILILAILFYFHGKFVLQFTWVMQTLTIQQKNRQVLTFRIYDNMYTQALPVYLCNTLCIHQQASHTFCQKNIIRNANEMVPIKCILYNVQSFTGVGWYFIKAV